MLTIIFSNIKLHLKKEKTKNYFVFYLKLCTVITELYVFNKDAQIKKKKNQVSTSNNKILNHVEIYTIPRW